MKAWDHKGWNKLTENNQKVEQVFRIFLSIKDLLVLSKLSGNINGVTTEDIIYYLRESEHSIFFYDTGDILIYKFILLLMKAKYIKTLNGYTVVLDDSIIKKLQNNNNIRLLALLLKRLNRISMYYKYNKDNINDVI